MTTIDRVSNLRTNVKRNDEAPEIKTSLGAIKGTEVWVPLY